MKKRVGPAPASAVLHGIGVTLAPSVDADAGLSLGANLMSNNHVCTPVELSELLFQFILRTWRFHEAVTLKDRAQSLADLQELSKRLWGNYSNRAAAHEGLANPQLAWLVQKNLRAPENVAVIENAVQFIVALAARRPCTNPAICRDKKTAASKWDQQGERLLAADGARNALNRLLALAGIVSLNNGRVPWRDLPAPVPSPAPPVHDALDTATKPAPPQVASSACASETASPPKPFDDLLTFAKAHLKGISRSIIDLVCAGNGECRLTDMAFDPSISWGADWQHAWESARRRINLKLRGKVSYQLIRSDNKAKLKTVEKPSKK